MAKDKDTPPTTPNGTNSTAFTDRDMKIIAGAIQCTKEGFTIDNGKLAAKCGFKTAESARVAWYGVKMKIDKMNPPEEREGGAERADAPLAASSGGGKKRKKSTDSKDDDDEEVAGEGFTAVNKVKKGRKSSSAEADGEATPTKPKAKGRKTTKQTAMAEELGLQGDEDAAEVDEAKVKEEDVEVES